MANIASGKNQRAHQSTEVNAPLFPNASPVVPSAALARVVTITDDGTVLVVIGSQAPCVALVALQVTADQLRRALIMETPVLVMAMDGDSRRPVIIGILSSTVAHAQRPATAMVDGRRIEITGQDEVALTCGKASITLTKAGKVIIKGVRISSSAEEVQRITGGSVQIN